MRTTRTPPNEPVERPTPETTETGTSYNTAPVLSEPTERLFDALLNRRREFESESESEPEPDRNPNPEPKEPMATTPKVEKPSEIKLNPPKPFTGKREELGKFLQDVGLYVAINSEIYNSDIRKIAYALSFMNEGDAASWKEEFLDNKANPTGPINLGTWKNFIDELEKAFKPYDAPGDALEKMKALRMGTNSIEDHIAHFKMLVTKSKLDTASAAVINMFRESLQIPLQRRILSLSRSHLPPFKNGTTGH